MMAIDQRTNGSTYRPVTRPVARPVTTMTNPCNTRHSAHPLLVRDATIPPSAGHPCSRISQSCRPFQPLGVPHA